MELKFKDGVVLNPSDGSYDGNYVFQDIGMDEVAELSKHFTEDNLSRFTFDGRDYTNYKLIGISWNGEDAFFNAQKKSETELVKPYVKIDEIPDEEAGDIPSIFDKWAVGIAYKKGDRVAYMDRVYKCLQDHTSQTDWTPDVATSLWADVLNPDPSVIPDWEQPGSTNPYMKGDKVRHVEKIWVSEVDNNVWEPGAAGTESLWTEVEE